jgi:hypothetical protein
MGTWTRPNGTCTGAAVTGTVVVIVIVDVVVRRRQFGKLQPLDKRSNRLLVPAILDLFDAAIVQSLR